jgi:hypothetical protein
MGDSRNKHRRQTTPDRGTGRKAKVVKPPGSSLSAERFPALTNNQDLKDIEILMFIEPPA